MKNSDVLKQQRTALEAEIEAIVSKAERSAEDDSAFDLKRKELDELNAKIDRAEAMEKFTAARAAAAGVTSTSCGRVKEGAECSAATETHSSSSGSCLRRRATAWSSRPISIPTC